MIATQTRQEREIELMRQGDVPDLRALEALDLPGDDGEPMENERERIQMNLLIESLDYHWRERQDFYVGGNMFVYYSLSQAREILAELDDPDRPKRAFRGPDFFVVLNVDGSYRRQKWVVWEEDGHYPDLLFEFLSPKTRHVDLGKKKWIYEKIFRTREYCCFDYLHPTGDDSLFGWRLDEHGQYQPITPDAQNRLWSEALHLWVGPWSGPVLRDTTVWARLFTPDGELVLTEAEAEHQRAEQAAQRAEQEAQRAERLAAQLRALGVEPNA